MSPLTAKLKCPHGTGEDTHGAEAVTEVASDKDGRGRKYHQSLFTLHSLKVFNRRFVVRPRASQEAWRKVQKHLDLNRFISFRNTATSGNDNTVRYVFIRKSGSNTELCAHGRLKSYRNLNIPYCLTFSLMNLETSSICVPGPKTALIPFSLSNGISSSGIIPPPIINTVSIPFSASISATLVK